MVIGRQRTDFWKPLNSLIENCRRNVHVHTTCRRPVRRVRPFRARRVPLPVFGSSAVAVSVSVHLGRVRLHRTISLCVCVCVAFDARSSSFPCHPDTVVGVIVLRPARGAPDTVHRPHHGRTETASCALDAGNVRFCRVATGDVKRTSMFWTHRYFMV